MLPATGYRRSPSRRSGFVSVVLDAVTGRRGRRPALRSAVRTHEYDPQPRGLGPNVVTPLYAAQTRLDGRRCGWRWTSVVRLRALTAGTSRAAHGNDAASSSNGPARMEVKKLDLSLYLVTDRGAAGDRSVAEVVGAAVSGGVSVVQLRDKDASSASMIALGKDLLGITKRRGIPLIVNDRLDVALAIGADGIHVGQEDMDAGEIRNRVGPSAILGVSAGTVEEAVQAELNGADYLGVGAIYPTSSKNDAGDAIGTDALARIVNSVKIPVVAIGGVSAQNARACIEAGAQGVAVISAIMSAEDPASAAATIRKHMLPEA